MPQWDISLTHHDKGLANMLETSGAATDLFSTRSDWRIGHLRHVANDIYNLALRRLAYFKRGSVLIRKSTAAFNTDDT